MTKQVCTALGKRISLEADYGAKWEKHFITEYSWTDMRTTILGFGAMSRCVFEDKDLVAEGRFLHPRMFSQVLNTCLNFSFLCFSHCC